MSRMIYIPGTSVRVDNSYFSQTDQNYSEYSAKTRRERENPMTDKKLQLKKIVWASWMADKLIVCPLLIAFKGF